MGWQGSRWVHLLDVMAIDLDAFCPPARMSRQPELAAFPNLPRINRILLLPSQAQVHGIAFCTISQNIRMVLRSPLPLKDAESATQPAKVKPSERVLAVIS